MECRMFAHLLVQRDVPCSGCGSDGVPADELERGEDLLVCACTVSMMCTLCWQSTHTALFWTLRNRDRRHRRHLEPLTLPPSAPVARTPWRPGRRAARASRARTTGTPRATPSPPVRVRPARSAARHRRTIHSSAGSAFPRSPSSSYIPASPVPTPPDQGASRAPPGLGEDGHHERAVPRVQEGTPTG